MNTFDQIKNNPVNRRAFLQRMGAAGLGVAAIALLDGCGGGNDNNGGGGGGGSNGKFPVAAIPGRNDNEKVLNFALTLEILEADLYRQALNIAVGLPVATPLRASASAYSAPTVSPGNVLNANAAFAYLRDFAFVEAAHREFLTAAIRQGGGTPVQRNPKGYKFAAGSGVGPGSSLATLLTGLYPLEEEGVSAYLGAAPFLTDLGLLQTAVGIYSTEARHSAAIAYILRLPTGPRQNIPGVGNRQKVQLEGVGTLPYNGFNNESPEEDIFEYFIPPQVVVQNIQPFFVA